MESLNRWLTLGANLGIVAGLFMVWLQLEQGDRFADVAQTNFEFETAYNSMDLTLGEDLPSAWARARLNASDMKDEELALVISYLDRVLFSQIIEELQEAKGVGTANTEQDAERFVLTYLDNDVGLRWWEQTLRDGGVQQLLPEFTDAVNAVITSRGPALRTREEQRIKALRDGPFPYSVMDVSSG